MPPPILTSLRSALVFFDSVFLPIWGRFWERFGGSGRLLGRVVGVIFFVLVFGMLSGFVGRCCQILHEK